MWVSKAFLLTTSWIGNEVQLFPIIPPCRVCTVAVAQEDADTCTEDSQTSHLIKWCVSCNSCNKLSHSSQWTWFCLTCFINRNQRFSFNKGQGFNELTHASVNVTDLSFFTFSDPFKVTLWCLSKPKLVSSPLIDGSFFLRKASRVSTLIHQPEVLIMTPSWTESFWSIKWIEREELRRNDFSHSIFRHFGFLLYRTSLRCIRFCGISTKHMMLDCHLCEPHTKTGVT